MHEATLDLPSTPSASIRPKAGAVHDERGMCRPEPGAGRSGPPTAQPTPGVRRAPLRASRGAVVR